MGFVLATTSGLVMWIAVRAGLQIEAPHLPGRRER
jgi:hypothetical protein